MNLSGISQSVNKTVTRKFLPEKLRNENFFDSDIYDEDNEASFETDFDIHHDWMNADHKKQSTPLDYHTNSTKLNFTKAQLLRQSLKISEINRNNKFIKKYSTTIKVAIASGLTSAGVATLENITVAEKMFIFSKFLPTFCQTASVNVSENITVKMWNNKLDKKKHNFNEKKNFLGRITSLLKSSTSKDLKQKYEYHFYIAYDYVDKNLDNFIKSGSFYKIFSTAIEKHCPKDMKVGLHFIMCDHTKRPAWAQNDAVMEAYMDNIDYFYRINDDTLMKTSDWTNEFVDVLINKYDPSNVGVVGPSHIGGNTGILTYDFVHRTHVEIFGYHYPRIFTDWWADNWITSVYEPNRSKKLSSVQLQHAMSLGQRYAVLNWKIGEKLKKQLEIDKKTLNRYIRMRNANENGRQKKQLQNLQNLVNFVDVVNTNILKSPTIENIIDNNSSVTSARYKVIAMSLYGFEPRIIWGAIRNVHLSKLYFPGWKIRFYVSKPDIDFDEHNETSSKYVPDTLKTFGDHQNISHTYSAHFYTFSDSNRIQISFKLISFLKHLGAEIRYVSRNTTINPINWKNFVILDQSVEWFLIRDARSRLTEAEAETVENWISKSISSFSSSSSHSSSLLDWMKKLMTSIFSSVFDDSLSTASILHAIRDHPSHVALTLPSNTWGGNAVALRNVLAQTVLNLKKIFEARNNDFKFQDVSSNINQLLDLPDILNADVSEKDEKEKMNIEKDKHFNSEYANINNDDLQENAQNKLKSSNKSEADLIKSTKFSKQNHQQIRQNRHPKFQQITKIKIQFLKELKNKLKFFLHPEHIDHITCKHATNEGYFIGQLFDEHELPYFNNKSYVNNSNVIKDRNTVENTVKFENINLVSPAKFCKNLTSDD